MSAIEAPMRVVAGRDHMATDDLIAYVLRRAHRTAESLDAPDEARAILNLAQSFADELAVGDPDFDRLRFIQTITDAPA
jgi:hypothetical protein